MSRSYRRQVRRRKGRATPLALAIIILVMPPSRMGSREIAVPAAGPAPGGSVHFLASPFGTIHAATFRFSPPVGTEIPAGSDLHHPAAINPDSGDGARHFPLTGGPENVEVNRSVKGPRLVPRSGHVKATPSVSQEIENPPSSHAGSHANG